MASFPDLRPGWRSAKAGSTAVRPRRSSLPLLAVSAALLFTAFIAVSELATLRGAKAHDASAYLTRELGSPLSSASLVRVPARNVRVTIRKGGFDLHAPEGSLSLVAQHPGSGTWRHFQHGALRTIAYGQEAVTMHRSGVEESLRIIRPQGRHTWRWRLDSSVDPRLSNGVVAFFDRKRMVNLEIDRVRIYDDNGRDITPDGAHWSLVRRGKTNWLELMLDDSKLATPYTIDPAVLRSSGTFATGTGALAVGIPSGVETGDLLVMPVTQATNTVPATPAGWALVPNSGGIVGGSGTKLGYATFYRKGVSTDAGTNATATTIAAGVAQVFVYRGVDTSLSGACPGAACMIRDAAAAPTAANTSATITLTTMSTSSASEEVVGTGTALANVNWPATSTTGSFARRSPANANNGTTISLGLYDKNVATAGSVTGTVGIVSNVKNLGFMFGLTNDTTNPTSGSETIGGISPAGVAYQPGAGGIFYYNGNVAGQFTISDPITDAQSGPQSVAYPAVGTSGWTHASETVSTGTSYTSSAYQWNAGTHTAPTAAERTLTEKDNGDNAISSNVVSIVDDSTAPTGGALTVNGGAAYSSTGSFAIDLRTDYTEAQSATASGLASSTLVRTSASYSSPNVCGAFGSATTLVGTPAQSGLATGCYRYTLTGTDNVGNTVSVSTTVKVDTSDPGAPSFTFASVGGGAFYPGSGTRVYFKPDAANGTFDITGSATDNDTDIASYAFPAGSAIGTNWSGSGSGSTRTYSYTATATTNGAQSVTATNYAGRTGSSAGFDITADSTPPSGGALTVNGGATYSSSGSFAIDTRTDYTEAQSATASGLASSTLVRTSASFSAADVCGSFGSPTTLVGTPAQSGLTTGCYRYTLTGTDNVGNAVSIASTVKVDTSDPSAPTLTPSTAAAGAYYPGTGTRVYFKPDAATGSFVLSASATDSDTGIASYAFPAGPALGTNWSASGSGSSRTYSYTGTATSNGSQSVTATNNAGRTASSSFDVALDSTAPSGGALTVNGGTAYSSSGSFAIDTRTDYTEVQSATASGLASSTLVRTSASFSAADVCGSFGSPTTLVGTPGQSGLTTGCYKYTLTGTDNVGNTVSISTTVKVDTSDPSAPTLTPSNAAAGAYYPGSGARVYFKPNAATGSFDLSASSTDGDTGIGSYTFPAASALGANWAASGSGNSRTYSYTATATSSGSQNVSATNNAGRTSSASTFDVALDSTAPAGGALTVNGGGAYSSTGSFTIDARTDYSEAQSATQSGLGSSTLVRTSASYSAPDVCGSFGSPTTLVGTPAQNGLSTGCYKYTLTGTDNVGNTASISTTVKVDASDPSAPMLSFAAVGGGAHYPGSGTRVYFKPDAAAGTFDITAGSTDNDSGIASYTFPAGSTLGTNWSGGGSGATRTYSYTATATTNGSQTLSAANNAGRSSSATFDLVADSTPPGGGALTVNGGGTYSSTGSFAIDSRTDYSETQSATASGLASSTLVRTNAGFASPDVCGSFGSPTTLVGTPAQSLATGCYRYTLTGTDNVGNTVSVSTTVKVDTSDPTAPSLSFSGPAGGVYYSGAGSRFYFKPDAANGTIDVGAASSDGDSGIASYTFPTGTAVGSNWSAS
ncbi:MAG: beta strand repeat-containing protein, partial [Gaiellaceae bacterium]